MCRVLGVSSSGYYAWAKRAPSARATSDAALMERIGAVHAASHGTYSSPRVHAELVESGLSIGRKRVARLMKAAGLAGVSRRRFVTTTVRDGGRQAPDLVQRSFTAGAPNVLWVADITYIPTWSGFLYLAVVLDAFSRRIVGWSMSLTLRRYRACGAEHGARRPQAEKRDPPFGSRLAIHIHRFRQPLPRGGLKYLGHGVRSAARLRVTISRSGKARPSRSARAGTAWAPISRCSPPMPPRSRSASSTAPATRSSRGSSCPNTPMRSSTATCPRSDPAPSMATASMAPTSRTRGTASIRTSWCSTPMPAPMPAS